MDKIAETCKFCERQFADKFNRSYIKEKQNAWQKHAKFF